MKKTITHTYEGEQHFCDFCQKEIQFSPIQCETCDKEACEECFLTKMRLYEVRDILEWPRTIPQPLISGTAFCTSHPKTDPLERRIIKVLRQTATYKNRVDAYVRFRCTELNLIQNELNRRSRARDLTKSPATPTTAP